MDPGRWIKGRKGGKGIIGVGATDSAPLHGNTKECESLLEASHRSFGGEELSFLVFYAHNYAINMIYQEIFWIRFKVRLV